MSVGPGARDLEILDCDGDGHLDVIVANSDAATISVVQGNGDGTFASQERYDVGPDPWALAPADFDGDGIVDLAVPPGDDLTAWCDLVHSTGLARYAEVATYGKFLVIPNDPQYPNQWALNNTGQGGGLPGADVDAEGRFVGFFALRAADGWQTETMPMPVARANLAIGGDGAPVALVNNGTLPGTSLWKLANGSWERLDGSDLDGYEAYGTGSLVATQDGCYHAALVTPQFPGYGLWNGQWNLISFGYSVQGRGGDPVRTFFDRTTGTSRTVTVFACERRC